MKKFVVWLFFAALALAWAVGVGIYVHALVYLFKVGWSVVPS